MLPTVSTGWQHSQGEGRQHLPTSQSLPCWQLATALCCCSCSLHPAHRANWNEAASCTAGAECLECCSEAECSTSNSGKCLLFGVAASDVLW